MKRNSISSFIAALAAVFMAVGCSVTKNLPAGELLYTGIEAVNYLDGDSAAVDDDLYDLADEAFAFPPNNALLGSSRVRTPLPVGLWVYNACVNRSGFFGRLLMKTMAKKPVLVSMVNPALRARAVTEILHNNGYFDGRATCSIVHSRKDSLQARVRYDVVFGKPYLLDSIEYRRMQNRSDTLLQLRGEERLLHRGDVFSLTLLEAERQRIANLIRDNGYYYFLPEYIVYQADSTLSPGRISLIMGLKQGVPRSILKPWYIGKVSFNIYGYDGEMPADSIDEQGVTLFYENRLRVKPSVLVKQLQFKSGETYSLTKQNATQSALNHLDMFRFSQIRYQPADTLSDCDTLNVSVNVAYDYPVSGVFDLRATVNDNDYAGPGASLDFTQRNLFGGGEALTASIAGSYEWYAGSELRRGAGLVNNYELGANARLTFPRLVLPRIGRRAYDFSALTRIDLNINQLNRAKYYSLLSFGGSLSYDFQPYAIRHHSFTPLRLVFNRLQKTTERFNETVQYNPSLAQSLENQFIPAIEYEYTLDNSSVRTERSKTVWRFAVSEAGNLISGLHSLTGKAFNGKKRIFGNYYSQYLKITTELRYNHYISRTQRLATRLGGGIIWSYGNSTVAPYNERFYAGGANSIRAFTIRGVGPGHFTPDPDNPYAYIDQNGDLKIEGNAEYRLRFVGNLEIAAFLDAGNVWLLRSDASRPDGRFRLGRLLQDIALGTGLGFRYDMEMLLFRFDIGYALHCPYSTPRRGYFNAPSFADALGFHLALGYPF